MSTRFDGLRKLEFRAAAAIPSTRITAISVVSGRSSEARPKPDHGRATLRSDWVVVIACCRSRQSVLVVGPAFAPHRAGDQPDDLAARRIGNRPGADAIPQPHDGDAVGVAEN